MGNATFPPPPPAGVRARGFEGISCQHCPGEDYLLPDGTPDYMTTCSGHGMCIDGTTCECEEAWAGFSLDCSQLACPREEMTLADGTEANLPCTGVGTCYNDLVTLNASVTACNAEGVTSLTPSEHVVPPIDFVAFYVNCDERTMTIARCQCTGITQSAPMCAPITLEQGSIQVLGAAGRRANPSLWLSLVLSTVVATAIVCRPRGPHL